MSAIRDEWARVIAHAWNDPDFMASLRADPKTTLEDDNIRELLNLSLISGGSFGGFLPLPEIPADQQGSDEAKLVQYINENGKELFGKMQFCTTG